MFFASIAHELRTPLNTIIPMVEKLKIKLDGEEDNVFGVQGNPKYEEKKEDFIHEIK